MKKIGVFVFCFLFSILSSNLSVKAYTFDGEFDPERFLENPEWEWVIIDIYPDLNMFLIKAENPEKGVVPQRVTFLVEMSVDNHLNTKKKLHLYILEKNKKQEMYLLTGESHFERADELNEDDTDSEGESQSGADTSDLSPSGELIIKESI